MPVFLRKGLFKTTWFLPGLLIALLAAGAFFITWGHPPAYYLSIYEGKSGKIVEQIMVEPGDMVELSYVHSADGTPVKAVFLIEEEGLRLLEEKYSWYGAGLESGSGRDFMFENDEVTVSGYDKIFKELPVRVARTVPQEIHLEERTILLNNLAPGGSLLVIRVDEK